jgi:ribosomal protein S18 acetylase RimI-like enzyme
MPVSQAILPDVPALNTLINSAYRGESSKKGWTTEADLVGGIRTDEEVLSGIIGKKDSVVLKYAGDDHVITGCVNLQKHGNKIYLGMLTVNPELQGKGIGKILLDAAEEYARNNNCASIYMTVVSVRKELVAWYERHGYKDTGARKSFPANDPKFGLPKMKLEFMVMEKKL